MVKVKVIAAVRDSEQLLLAAKSEADMIEIMPGTVSKVIKTLKKELDMPIVAGGLIETTEEIEDAVLCGVAAISTGKKEFWDI